jgi:ribosomal protein S14
VKNWSTLNWPVDKFVGNHLDQCTHCGWHHPLVRRFCIIGRERRLSISIHVLIQGPGS